MGSTPPLNCPDPRDGITCLECEQRVARCVPEHPPSHVLLAAVEASLVQADLEGEGGGLETTGWEPPEPGPGRFGGVRAEGQCPLGGSHKSLVQADLEG